MGSELEIAGLKEEEGDVRNVFAQESRAFWGQSTRSRTISGSGSLIQGYRQVTWVYLT